MILFEQWLDLTCRSFIHRVSEGFERTLSPLEKLKQTTHRLICSVCRVQERRLAQLRALVSMLGKTSPDTPAEQLSTHAVERIREAMSQSLRGPAADETSNR